MERIGEVEGEIELGTSTNIEGDLVVAKVIRDKLSLEKECLGDDESMILTNNWVVGMKYFMEV